MATPEVRRMLSVIVGEMNRTEIMSALANHSMKPQISRMNTDTLRSETPRFKPRATPPPMGANFVFCVCHAIRSSVPICAIRGQFRLHESGLGLRDEKHFREHYQQAGIAAGVIEMTIPDKPKSRLQKYRLTAAGQRLPASPPSL